MYEAHKLKKVAELKKNHYEWREKNFKYREGFFPVFKDFKDFMKKLSPGAIALFVYLGLNSNNLTGESSHSIESMASFFGKSTRTISLWLKELENEGLIERVQLKFNGVSHTFIIPYSSKNQEQQTKFDINNNLPF